MEKENKNILTNENYYSAAANKDYMSASQFKDFLKCEAYAMAKIKGEWEDEQTPALLVGSYVDAYFSGELDEFKQTHPEIFKKDGTLKSDYLQAEDLIKVIEDDPLLLGYLSGKHQVIYTGEIAGVPFKGKFDSDFDDMIVDGKVMKDLKPVWVDTENGGRERLNFVMAYRYDIQGAIYQELKRQRQNTSAKVPFVLDVITKEKVPDKAPIEIDQETLDIALKEVVEKSPRYQDIKLGFVKPTYCGKCDYCKSLKKVQGIRSYHDFDPKGYNDYANEEN